MIRRGKERRNVRYLRLAVVGILAALTAAIWCVDALPPPSEWFVDDTRYREEIAVAAGRHGIDPDLVRALIFQESRFDPSARGSRGEIGLMQILPSGAAAEWARVLKRPRPSERDIAGVELNLEIGCWYLARALRRWKDDEHALELALAQYNAGGTRARKWASGDRKGGVVRGMTVKSTRKYVTNIMNRYRMYRRRRGLSAPSSSVSKDGSK